MSATTTDRPKTYEELVSDTTPWTMSDIARQLAVQPQTVRSWRKDSLAAGRPVRAGARVTAAVPHPNHLPPTDIPVEGKPTWKAGTIRKWAIQTGRMSETGEAQRLKPPGRPRSKAA